MWRYLVPIALFAVLAVFFFRGLDLSPGYVPSPLIGKPAPRFELPRLEDPAKTISHEVLRGRVALLNVWATWCVGCREEHAFLNDVARTSGVPIYGLNWKDDRGSALDWLARLGNPYTASAFDETGTVAIDWGVYGAPETFLVGADGMVLFKHIAPLTPEIWRRDFVPLIKTQCGAYPCP
jgi:cytochrome c biogenesis protein CcmG/thiol:disulfide interchange protein DsbE